MQWLLESGHGLTPAHQVLLYRRRREHAAGLISYGAQLTIAGDLTDALDAFAQETRAHLGLRSFVGPKAAVDALWERLRVWHPPPTTVRASQPLYVLHRDALNAGSDPGVRPAEEGDADAVAEASAEMIRGELGYDPRQNRAGWAAAVRRAIAGGAWWVWVARGELRFQCNVGPRTTATAQIQGVWTPPERRGRGYARQALGAIARRLLERDATVSLYVNDFNAPAIALYERLGFVRKGTMTTYLFP